MVAWTLSERWIIVWSQSNQLPDCFWYDSSDQGGHRSSIAMLYTYVVLCLAAATGGAINSIAGGGTLLTFPALFEALGSAAPFAVIANATSTVALVPGSIAGAWGYRREMRESGQWARLLVVPSLLGGLVGAGLLVSLPPESFKALVPWLILTAALLFALQPQISRWTGIGQPHRPARRGGLIAILGFQFLVAVYGGYFGAGIGILMLSSLAMMGMSDIHQMNAVKTLMASLINGISAMVFIASDAVHWPFALSMALAAIVGGYLGAHTARRLNRKLVRFVVVCIGFFLASYYFYRQFSTAVATL